MRANNRGQGVKIEQCQEIDRAEFAIDCWRSVNLCANCQIRVFADTKGHYRDEPVRLFDCVCQQVAASASEQNLITPGSFEFELGRRPSVLILSIEGYSNAQRDQHVGVFLADLMQENRSARSDSSVDEKITARTDHLAAA